MIFINVKTGIAGVAIACAVLAFVMLGGAKPDLSSSKGGVYSPDGQKIAFFSDKNLWIMNANGHNVERVTHSRGYERWAQFSTDGRKLAYIANGDGDWEVNTIHIDGSNHKQISVNEDTDLGGSFSPDGQTLVIGAVQAGAKAKGLYLVDVDGQNRRNIVENGLWPRWSHDGETILYGHALQTENEFDIWAYNTGSKQAYALTKSAGNNYGGAASRDGSKIVFVSDRDGVMSIYEMAADGTHQRSLNIRAIMDASPNYSPDGRYICS